MPAASSGSAAARSTRLSSPVADRATLVPRSFFDRPAPKVAPELLGKVLIVGDCAVRIVETEAYTEDDPASHSFRGQTKRNASMFGPPGHLYVYFTYGMHWCANIVCGPSGCGEAVLLRAGEPLRGLAAMLDRRPIRQSGRRQYDLTNGPAKLTSALGIDRLHDGLDLCRDDAFARIVDDATLRPRAPVITPRIGIRVATERKWRWAVADSVWVSRRGPSN